MEFPEFSCFGKFVLSADQQCFLVFLVNPQCQKCKMALNSAKRLKSRKSKVPEQCRPACTAKIAQQLKLGFFFRWKNLAKSTGENSDSNVNKYHKLPDNEKIATIVDDFLITTGGVFVQVLTINSEPTRVTKFCLLCLRIFLGKH